MRLAACGAGYKIRPMQLEETAALSVAADPLLKQAGLRCKVAVTLNDVPDRELDVLPPPTADFCVALFVSRGAVELLRARVLARGRQRLEDGEPLVRHGEAVRPAVLRELLDVVLLLLHARSWARERRVPSGNCAR